MVEPTCPRCHGAQWLYSNDGLLAQRCICLERKLRRAYLGDQIDEAVHVESELYQPKLDAEGKTVGDRTKENLFLKGSWAVTCSHLKWVLGGKYYYEPGFRFRIVDDDRLLRVWMGDYHARHRAPKDDPGSEVDVEEIHNNVRSIAEPPQLLIVRLGIVQRNRAAAGVLLEALMIRGYADKPTWVVEGAIPFGPGHNTWSSKVSEYLAGNYNVIDLGGDVAADLNSPDFAHQPRESASLSIDHEADEKYVAPFTFQLDETGLGSSKPKRRSGGDQ